MTLKKQRRSNTCTYSSSLLTLSKNQSYKKEKVTWRFIHSLLRTDFACKITHKNEKHIKNQCKDE